MGLKREQEGKHITGQMSNGKETWRTRLVVVEDKIVKTTAISGAHPNQRVEFDLSGDVEDVQHLVDEVENVVRLLVQLRTVFAILLEVLGELGGSRAQEVELIHDLGGVADNHRLIHGCSGEYEMRRARGWKMSAPTLVFHGVTIFCLLSIFGFVRGVILLYNHKVSINLWKRAIFVSKKWSFLFQKVVIPLLFFLNFPQPKLSKIHFFKTNNLSRNVF